MESMKTPNGNWAIDPSLLAQVDKLPDRALVKIHRPVRGKGCWYAVLSKPSHESCHADFSTGALTKDEVVKICAQKIRNDLRGIGKYATHFQSYELTFKILPYWKKRASRQRYKEKLSKTT